MRRSNKSSFMDMEKLKRSLSQRVERLRAELSQANRELEAADLSLSLLKRGRHNEIVDGAENSDPYLKEFEGLTQVEGLIKLAQDSGRNRFKMRDAVKKLTAAGLVRSKKNAGVIIYTAIQRSGKFKRVAPGEYEVILKPVMAMAGSSIESIKRVG